MERIMAAFGQGYVQAAVLSENNAVKYRFSIAGSCTKSTVKPYVKLQDEAFGSQNFQAGMTVIEIDPATNTEIARKGYLFSIEPSATNRAFMTYVDSVPAGRLLIFISNGKLNTCPELIPWFKSHGSTAWPTVWDIERFDMSYSAFYISGRNTITAEHILFNDRVHEEDVSTPLDLVFDNYTDIGATGYPTRTIEYDNEKRTGPGTSREIIRLPENTGLITPCKDYNISPGDVIYTKFDLIADQALLDYGTTRLSIRWFTDGVSNPISTVNIEANARYPDRWQPFERYLVVPATATGFTVYIAKTVDQGEGGARNVVFSEITRQEAPMMRPAEFGVNGIRMNTMNDNNKTDSLLVLTDPKFDDRGIVTSAEFREF